MSDKWLGKVVVARTGQGDFHFVGRCFSYCDAPTLGVELPNGDRSHWRADMCEVIEMPDEAITALFRPTEAGQQGTQDKP